MRGYAAKRDDNEKPILAALRSAGWSVFQLSQPGLPDLLCVREGRVVFLEVKLPKKREHLTDSQREVFPMFERAGRPVLVVTTPEEALAAAFGTEDHIEALAKAFAEADATWDAPMRPPLQVHATREGAPRFTPNVSRRKAGGR